VAERAQEAIAGIRRDDLRLLRHTLVAVKHCLLPPGSARMQFQIHHAEVDLTQHHGSRSVVTGGLQATVQLLWQSLPGAEVLGKAIESGAVVTPVLHELTRQFYCVPLHTPGGRVSSRDE
jgi:hypothetical protein